MRQFGEYLYTLGYEVYFLPEQRGMWTASFVPYIFTHEMKKYDFSFYLTRFLTTYLPSQRGIKANTQLSYRDTFSLLLIYCKEQESIQPDKVKFQLLDRELINRFLNWLEETRNCKPATRNQRLAATHSFFRFLIIECPEKIEQCQQILGIPMKKVEQPLIKYLSLEGTKALLEQPDVMSLSDRRDSVLLTLMYDTGCRVQKLVDLRVCDITLLLSQRASWQTGIEISYIQRDLITVIFYYQISLKPLKTLSLSQVSFPLLFPLYYIVP